MLARWSRVLACALVVLSGVLGPGAASSASTPPTDPAAPDAASGASDVPSPLFVDFRTVRGKCVPPRPDVPPGPPTNLPPVYPPSPCAPTLIGSAVQFVPRSAAAFSFYRCSVYGTVTFEIWRDGALPNEAPLRSITVSAAFDGSAVWRTTVPTTPGTYVARASCYQLASYATFRFTVIGQGSSGLPPGSSGSGSGSGSSTGSGSGSSSPLPGTGGEPWSLVRTGTVLLLAGGGIVLVSRHRRRPRPVAG